MDNNNESSGTFSSDNNAIQEEEINPLLIPLILEKVFSHLFNFRRFRTEDKKNWKSCRLVCQRWNELATKLFKSSHRFGITITAVNEIELETAARLQIRNLMELLLTTTTMSLSPQQHRSNMTRPPNISLAKVEADFANTQNMPFTRFRLHRDLFSIIGDKGSNNPVPALQNFLSAHPSWIVVLEVQLTPIYIFDIGESFGAGCELPLLKKLSFVFMENYPRGVPMRPLLMHLILGLLRPAVNLQTLNICSSDNLPNCILFETALESLYSRVIPEIPSSVCSVTFEGFPLTTQIHLLAQQRLGLKLFDCSYFPLASKAVDVLEQTSRVAQFFHQQSSSLEILRLCTEHHGGVNENVDRYVDDLLDLDDVLPVFDRLKDLSVDRWSLAKLHMEKFPLLQALDLSRWWAFGKFPQLFQFPKGRGRDSSPCSTLNSLSLGEHVDAQFIRNCARFFPNVKDLGLVVNVDVFETGIEDTNAPIAALFQEYRNGDVQKLTITHCWDVECAMDAFHPDRIVAGIPYEFIYEWKESGGRIPNELEKYQKLPSINWFPKLRELVFRNYKPRFLGPFEVTKITVHWATRLKKLRYLRGFATKGLSQDNPLKGILVSPPENY